jgi:cell division protein FtsW
MKLRRPPESSRLRLAPRYHEPDWWLLAVLLALVMFGTVMIYSASMPAAADGGSSAFGQLAQQCLFAGVGLVGLLLAMRIDYHRYAPFAFPAMLAVLALLAAIVVVPGLGTSVYGAKRWIMVGPLSIQPSELAKPILILYMATWLVSKRERVRSFTYGVAQFAVIIGLLVGLVMLQPDLGTSALLTTVGVAMFFVAGAEIVQFGSSVLVGATVLLTLALSASYRRERLLVFLNPDADVRNLGWQLYQARLAMGSGGLLGLGLGASRSKFTWLPAAHNDAIFAVVGEELGLAGCAAVLLLFGVLGYRGYRAALRAPDALGALLAVGITTWLIFQAAYNIGGITLAIPFTGIPLPFISSGGTSLVVGMTSVGVLLNITRQTVSAAELEPRVATDDAEPIRQRATTTHGSAHGAPRVHARRAARAVERVEAGGG